MLQHVVSYSISQGSIVNVITFRSEPEREGSTYPDSTWVTECSRQELLGCYAGWEPEVIEMLQVSVHLDAFFLGTNRLIAY